jgi:hypothetical protein
MHNHLIEKLSTIAVHTSKQARLAQVQKSREQSAEGFEVFCSTILKDDQTNKQIVIADHQKEWINFIFSDFDWDWLLGSKTSFDGYFKTILSHPKAGKSPIIAKALPLFFIGHNQNLRITIVCNSDTNATNRCESIGRYIELDEDYHEVFPYVQRDPALHWNEHEKNILRQSNPFEHTVQAYSVDSRVTGTTVDIIIGDDVVDEDDWKSQAIRQSRIEKWNRAWIMRLRPGGGLSISIGTRWCVGDLWEDQLKNPNYRFLIQGVAADLSAMEQPPVHYRVPPWNFSVANSGDPKQIPLWRLMPKRELARRAANPTIFACCFRQIPYSESDRIFELAAVEKMFLWDVAWTDLVPVNKLGQPIWPAFMGVDPSGPNRRGTALFTAVSAPDGRMIVLPIWRGAGDFGPDTAAEIHREYQLYGHSIINVESNAAQRGLVNLLRRAHERLPVRAVNIGMNKVDPHYGIPNLAARINQGRWIVPCADIISHREIQSSCQCGRCAFRRELINWPATEGDTVMACFLCDLAAETEPASDLPEQFYSSRTSVKSGRHEHPLVFSSGKSIFGHGYGRRRIF